MSKNNFFQKKVTEFRHYRLQGKIHTELDIAVQEILQRRADSGLVKEVETFLGADIPNHFLNDTPVFYLSRYLATPDYETLFYVNQVQKYNYPVIIGEDTSDIVTSHSALKRNLLKLPIITGESKNGRGIVEYERVADLNTEQGKKIKDARLLNGNSLVDLHHSLAKQLLPKQVTIIDESGWVDRHSRGKLITLYESMLALLVVHGIMLEYYELSEVGFMADTVLPALEKTKERFGYTPLIAPLTQKHSRKIADFNSYPNSVKKFLSDA